MGSFDGDTKSTAEPVPTTGPLWLTVLSDRGLACHALPPIGRVTIGRASDCTIVIEDDSLSRNHAALWLTHVELEIEDLGSRNGTRIGEQALSSGERRRVVVGEPIVLGNSTLILRNSPPDERPRRVLTHGQLEICLESECARAADGGRGFALACVAVQADGAAPAEVVPRLERIFAGGLRPSDLLAAYTPGVYEIVLLGCDRSTAGALLEELQRQAATQGLTLVTQVAAYPIDGRSAEELIDAVARPRSADGRASDLARSLHAPNEKVRRMAASDLNVLITGETGVGKEVMARTIHELSPRAALPLVTLNCAAFTENLLESELFGFERGAFTGAVKEKQGLLESADGGTVFLDEIGEMPLAIQARLLRVIELKQVQRIGALRPRQLDVRFLSATNRELEAEVAGGRFRADLLFRLNGMPLHLAPLRERVDEIEPLAELFLTAATQRMKLGRAPRLADATRKLLRAYRWPGNVRELRNAVERAVVLCDGEVITPDELPLEKMTGRLLELPSRQAGRRVTSFDQHAEDATAAGRQAELDRRAIANRGLDRDEERQRVIAALDAAQGNQTEAARLLGVSRRTLVNRIEEFGLQKSKKR